jgi:hypothetical protein
VGKERLEQFDMRMKRKRMKRFAHHNTPSKRIQV